MLRKIIAMLMLVLACTLCAEAGQRKFVLVIDAGHGGKDAGAVGAKSKEKTLTLKYALAFGQLVERSCPDVKVVYTRKTDRFLELWQRAEIANKQKADLFLSIHINALPKGHVARGFQTYTLGRGRVSGSNRGFMENLEVAKRENAVILYEDNYKQRYQGYDPNSPESDIMFEFIQEDNMQRSVELARLMQKKVCAATGRKDLGAYQDNLAVLRLTSMPGCLIELGFISTSDEEAFLNSSGAPGKYARGILNAFVAYKSKYGWKTPPLNVPEPAAADSPPSAASGPDVSSGTASAPAPAATSPAVSDTPAVADSAPPAPPVPAPLAAPSASAAPSAPVFKVQIMTSDRRLKAGDPRFKGLTDVESYKDGRVWKYTVGASADYNAVNRRRKEVAAKFPEAFIIAFRDGERIDVQAAIQEFKQRKNKK